MNKQTWLVYDPEVLKEGEAEQIGAVLGVDAVHEVSRGSSFTEGIDGLRRDRETMIYAFLQDDQANCDAPCQPCGPIPPIAIAFIFCRQAEVVEAWPADSVELLEKMRQAAPNKDCNCDIATCPGTLRCCFCPPTV